MSTKEADGLETIGDPMEVSESGEGEVPKELEDVEEAEVDDSDSDDWEEVTMVATVNGILDADIVRDAVERKLIILRHPDTNTPVLQINNSLYTASWNQDLGTNLVLQATGKEMEVVSCTSTMMAAEKALLTSLSTDGSPIAAKAEVAPRAALSRTQPRK